MADIELKLQADGFTARWELKSSPASREMLIGHIVVELAPELGGAVSRSVEVAIPVNELLRLRDYIAKHVAATKNGVPVEEYTFLGYDLGFQLQTIDGEIDEAGGVVGLRVLVNVGKSSSGQRVFAGAESIAPVEAVNDFVAALSSLESR